MHILMFHVPWMYGRSHGDRGNDASGSTYGYNRSRRALSMDVSAELFDARHECCDDGFSGLSSKVRGVRGVS